MREGRKEANYGTKFYISRGLVSVVTAIPKSVKRAYVLENKRRKKNHRISSLRLLYAEALIKGKPRKRK